MPLRVPGIEVCLRSGGKEIPSYKPEQPDARKVTAYVPSQSGQAFDVCLNNMLNAGEGLAYETHIDGRLMQKLIVSPRQRSVMEGVYLRPGFVRPFVFSDLRMKEDDGEESTVDMSKLGLIEIIVWRAYVKVLGPSTITNNNVQSELAPVSERAKKIGWHSVKLGNETRTTELNTAQTTYIDDVKRPFAVFRFRYQPRELLEDQGIIPCVIEAPKAPVAVVKRPADEDSGAERSPKRRVLSPGNKSVKEEPKTKSSSPPDKTQLKPTQRAGSHVKQEPKTSDNIIDLTNRPASPIRAGKFKGAVIDLTLD